MFRENVGIVVNRMSILKDDLCVIIQQIVVFQNEHGKNRSSIECLHVGVPRQKNFKYTLLEVHQHGRQFLCCFNP